MMWKFKLGLFLFCLVVLAVANVIYVVIETTTNHHHHHIEDEDLPLETPIHINSRLRDLSTVNLLQNSKQPCEDFYNYTCAPHGFIEDTLTHVRRTNHKLINDIIKNKNITNDVTRLYTSCEDYRLSSSSSSSSSKIVSTLLTSTGALRNYNDLAFLWGRLQLYDAITPLEFRMITNPWQTDSDLPTIEQSGLFDDVRNLLLEEHRISIEERLSTIYQKEDAREWSLVIVDIESTLSSIFHEDRQSFLSYLLAHGQRDLLNDWRTSISDLRFNVTTYLLGCRPPTMTAETWLEKLYAHPLWCRAQTYLASLPSIIVKYPLQAWIVYTKYSILLLNDVPTSNYGTSESVLTSVMPTTDIDRYLSIDRQHLDCILFTSEWLNAEVVQLYTEAHGDQGIVDDVNRLASDLQSTFVHLLRPHAELQEKVAATTLSIGTYRQVNRSWTLSDVDFIDNVLRLKRDRITSRFLGEREELVLPLHVGARYRHQANTLDISIGLLREPLFVRESRAQLYAQLATILGHELAHSIDGIGVNFDARGNYAPMSLETTRLVSSVLSSSCVAANRERTQNEDYADVLGVNLAYWTMMAAPESNDDDRRLFFETYALRFCHRPMTDYERMIFVGKSTHSLAEYRVNNVLRSNEDFNALYTCTNDNCIKLY